MSNDKLENAIRRGQRAQELLANPLLNEAWDAYEKSLTTAWMNSPPSHEKQREHIYIAISILRHVRANLTDALNTGEIAQNDLDWLRNEAVGNN